jgi:hypothetical protein
MMFKADTAAKRLFYQIEAPAGSFNTLAFVDSNGPYIRVLIDGEYFGRVPNIPTKFEGLRVLIERREAVRAVDAISLGPML